MKLISWNVNGIRSILGKGFAEFAAEANADILCLQETKAHPDQLTEVIWPEGYLAFWNSAQKKGYSGTAIFTRHQPLDVTYGIGKEDHDTEGRVITMELPEFYLVNVYVPNSQRGLHRLSYRTQHWGPDFRTYLKSLEAKKPVIFCGDLNVAHREIDLARPKDNIKNAGFTPEERSDFDALLSAGFVDTFREFEPSGGHYSWWSYQSQARARNIGWRIDYFCVSESLKPRLKSAYILPHVMGSDHCPVGLEIN